MAQRPDQLTVSLGQEHEHRQAALAALARRLGFDGNISKFLRWLADTADGAPAETATLLNAAGNIAAGGDDWSTLAVVESLLPALRLTVDWDRVDNPPREVTTE